MLIYEYFEVVTNSRISLNPENNLTRDTITKHSSTGTLKSSNRNQGRNNVNTKTER